MSSLEERTFLILLISVSLAFAWILWPFYGAILWALVFATVFAPAHRRLQNSMRRHPNLAALVTVLTIVTIVLLPLALTAASVVQEATNLYEKIETGELDFGRLLSQLFQALPGRVIDLLALIGISDIGDVQARLSTGLRQASQFLATQAIAIGQGTAHIVISFFLMLYLLFFFLRDGSQLAQRLKDAIPLRSEQKRALFSKFTIVIRAMFKGTILVAALQGMLGGIIFWLVDPDAGLVHVLVLLPDPPPDDPPPDHVPDALRDRLQRRRVHRRVESPLRREQPDDLLVDLLHAAHRTAPSPHRSVVRHAITHMIMNGFPAWNCRDHEGKLAHTPTNPS